MKKKSTHQSAFLNLRIAFALLFCLTGVFIVLGGSGPNSVSQNQASGASPEISSGTFTHETRTVEAFPTDPSRILSLQEQAYIATLTPATRSTFMARWDSVQGAVGYRLDVSTDSSFANYVDGYQDLDVGDSIGRLVTGLNRGTMYYYRVRAYDRSGLTSNAGSGTATTMPTAGLVITPVFDTSILTDPNSVAIQAAINQSINIEQTLFSDMITIVILFRYTATADPCGAIPPGTLGRSCTCISTMPWATYINALIADATTANDATANASLPGAPLTANVTISTANGRSVGLATPGGGCGIGPYDATITFSPGVFSFTRPPAPGTYDLQRTAEHEIDEVMGLGANADNGATAVRPSDIFSWSAPGTRNLTTAGSRYLSINSGTTNIVDFNQMAGGDFGDWISPACPQPNPFVQNAFSCTDQFSDVTATSPEGINLDVVGYNLGVAAPPPTFTIATFSSPPNGGTTSGGGTYADGATATVVATANPGFTFTAWSENGVVQSTSPSYSFTVHSNRNLVANFAAVPPPPPCTPGSGSEVDGIGSIAANGGQASFTFHVRRPLRFSAFAQGYFMYNDPGAGVGIANRKLTRVSINGNHAHFSGQIRMNRRVRGFTVDVDDCPDFFAVRIDGFYSASGPLTDGDIIIHQ